MSTILVLAFLFVMPAAWAQKVAIAKGPRGQVTVEEKGKKVPLVADQWISAGAVVETSEKSFVRLVFIDQSKMNIGPKSKINIEQFGGEEAGVIEMVKGKIRSEVSKDYMRQKNKDQSKLFIKTPNAVMGVRGTDFMISSNGTSTSTVLLHGEVVFNKLDTSDSSRTPAARMTTADLEQVVNGAGRAVIQPGEFSVVSAEAIQPTVPSILNVSQLETIEKNVDFSAERAPSSDGADKTVSKSIVPPGLDGAAVANQPEALKTEVQQMASVVESAPVKTDAVAAAGFEQNGVVKPANGSFLHVDSGTVVAPPKDAVFDPNSNSFISSASSGTVSADGSYEPPKNVTITDSGKILVQAGGQVVEVKPTSAVMGKGPTLGDVMQVATASTAATTNAGAKEAAAAMVAVASGGTVAARPAAATPNAVPVTVVIPKEAPTLCSTCGGAIPGTAVTVKETSTVTFRPQ